MVVGMRMVILTIIKTLYTPQSIPLIKQYNNPLNKHIMYATSISDIKVPYLHDAALACKLKGFKFRSLYMDSSGECAISYYGILSEQEIAEIMLNFCYLGEDKSYDEINPKVWKDYEFMKGNSSEGNPDYTTIYTPDGLDYRTLKI